MSNLLNFIRLNSLANPLVPDFKSLYDNDATFPQNERMSWSFFERTIANPRSKHVVLAVTDTSSNEFVGLATYQLTDPDLKGRYALFVWYLATVEWRREQGIGAQILTHLKEIALAAGCTAIVLEVAIPEAAMDPKEAIFDRRRIGFYERSGFYRLDGCHYLQSIDAEEENEDKETLIPMYLMLMPLNENLTASDLYDVIESDFGSSVTKIGNISLVRLPGR